MSNGELPLRVVVTFRFREFLKWFEALRPGSKSLAVEEYGDSKDWPASGRHWQADDYAIKEAQPWVALFQNQPCSAAIGLCCGLPPSAGFSPPDHGQVGRDAEGRVPQ